jgi:hypothetical protein
MAEAHHVTVWSWVAFNLNMVRTCHRAVGFRDCCCALGLALATILLAHGPLLLLVRDSLQDLENVGEHVSVYGY